jgi:galactose-1-phosphate uridylyltransferase
MESMLNIIQDQWFLPYPFPYYDVYCDHHIIMETMFNNMVIQAAKKNSSAAVGDDLPLYPW